MIDVGTYPAICDRIDGVSRKSKPQSDRLLAKCELATDIKPAKRWREQPNLMDFLRAL